MSIKEFIDKASGNWVSPKTCIVNDMLTIKSVPSMDNTTFQGKTYLIMDVAIDRLPNQPMKLRLGGQQAKTLMDTFGEQAQAWLNRRVKIVAKVPYPGLNKEGFIYAPA